MKPIKTLRIFQLTLVAVGVAVLGRAQSVPPPGIAIAKAGTNQFLITVTNGVTNASYTVFSQLELGNPAYPWTFLTNGAAGVTNFTVNMGAYDIADFFLVGGSYSTGIPTWELADPNNPSLGVLTVTIVSPTNNSTLQ